MYQNIVAVWSGAIVDIPANWQLCDGTNGTPDLAGLFVRGSQGSYSIGDLGGHLAHGHTFTSDGHWHPNWHFFDVDEPGVYHEDTDLAVDTGITGSADNIPPYYTLAYIMRMS